MFRLSSLTTVIELHLSVYVILFWLTTVSCPSPPGGASGNFSLLDNQKETFASTRCPFHKKPWFKIERGSTLFFYKSLDFFPYYFIHLFTLSYLWLTTVSCPSLYAGVSGNFFTKFRLLRRRLLSQCGFKIEPCTAWVRY
jgi:hypothetical protein